MDMKLYNYNSFVNESMPRFKEDIDAICSRYKIKNYTINKDLSIDVNGDVYISGLGRYRTSYLPLKFGKVRGVFNCSNNDLVSLEGCPYEVGGDFDCSSNKLKSLEGCPQKVGDSFRCSYNRLTSLKGSPTEIPGDFVCYDNDLLNLKGGPQIVFGYFACPNNSLISLEGVPKSVGSFNFSNNRIRDFKIFPEVTTRLIIKHGNPVQEISNLFWDLHFHQELEVIEYLNEYDVIRDGHTIILQALELVYDEFGLEVPENIEIEGYEII